MRSIISSVSGLTQAYSKSIAANKFRSFGGNSAFWIPQQLGSSVISHVKFRYQILSVTLRERNAGLIGKSSMYYNHLTGQKQNSHGPQNSGVHSSYKAEEGVMVSENSVCVICNVHVVLVICSFLFYCIFNIISWDKELRSRRSSASFENVTFSVCRP